MGEATINEIRKEHGLPPIEGGDMHLTADSEASIGGCKADGKKKSFPKCHPDRAAVFEEIAEKLISDLDAEYEISALDFLQLADHIKKSGLKHFHL